MPRDALQEDFSGQQGAQELPLSTPCLHIDICLPSVIISQTSQPTSYLHKAEVCEGTSQLLAFSSVEVIERAVECSRSQTPCPFARCQEAQDFSSAQGINPKSTAQIAAPIANSSEFKKEVPNLGTWYYYSSSWLKSNFYGEMLESNPFYFSLNKQYQRRESMYHVAHAGCVAGRYIACMTRLYLSLT